LKPSTLAPLFVLTALFHAASVASRFDLVAAELPSYFATTVLFAQLPLLLIEGYFEGMLDYGPGVGPTWMRIKSRPVKFSFTFAFLYLVIVVMQTWNISLGPIDPTPPKEWPETTRSLWFAGFSAGMFFPNYVAASGSLIPALRFITAPLRKLPSVVSVIIASVIGVGAGWGATQLLASSDLGSAASTWKTLKESSTYALPIALAVVWIPILFGLVLSRLKKKADS
jgi:hypothetical protein